MGPSEHVPAPQMPGHWLSRRDLLRRSGQLAALGVAGAGLAPLLAACGSSDGDGGSTGGGGGQPKTGGTLTRTGGSQAGLNPILNTTTQDRGATSQLFDGLIGWDAAGNLKPLIAEDLGSISADGLTYTFKLRSGVQWSDGKPLTSKDFLLTYQMLYLPKFEAVTSGYRGNISAYLDEVTAPDERTIVFRLKKPYSPWLANGCFIPALPAHVFDGLSAEEINKAPFNNAPTACSGAWKFDTWIKQDHTTYTRNTSYYGKKTNLDKIVAKFIPPGQSSLSSLQTGELDVALITSASEYLQLKNNSSLGNYLIPNKGITNYWYQMDPNKSPAGRIFSDKRVRQALVYGLDRNGINKAIYSGTADVADSFFATVSWAYNSNVSPKYNFDAAKAGSLLDQAGWTKGSSGVREKDGEKLKFTITTAANAQEYVLAAQAMASDWKKLGCDVSVNPIQYAQLLSVAYFDRKFDVIIPGFGFQVDPDLSYTFHSRNISPGGQNAGSYRNSEVDQLLDEGVLNSDQAKRKEIYSKLGDVLADEVPAVPIVRTNGFVIYNKRVHGLDDKSFGTFTAFINQRFWNDVWVG